MNASPFRVLVTRTEPGVSRQAHALLAKGLQPVKLPLIEIEPVAFVLAKDVPEVAIALSAHAALHGAEAIRKWGDRPQWLAVGKATARALEAKGIQAAHPEEESSEGLLATPELTDCAQKTIAILCGASPRPLLGDTLRARGADVSEYYVYRRLPVKRISDYHEHFLGVSAVMVSSVEGLHAFAEIWRAGRGASSVMLCVNSIRAARAARLLGFDNLRLSRTQSPGQLADSVFEWLTNPNKGRWHE